MPLDDLTIRRFLDDLASKTPIPGGGAAASISGALAAALASMVVSYSLGKKSLADHQPALESAARQLASMRESFLTLAEDDARAYGALNAALRLEKDDPARGGSLEAATKDAVAAPIATLERADALLKLCEALALITNPNLRSDLGIAAVLACASSCASQWNVLVNAPLLDEASPGQGALALAKANRLVADCRERSHHVESLCAARA